MPEKPEFTPGEWKFKTDGTLSGKWISIYVDDETWDGAERELFRSETIEVSADGISWEDHANRDEIIGNVRIAIASPDLYEACEAIIGWYDDDHDTLQQNYEVKHAAIEKIRAALAKARGEA